MRKDLFATAVLMSVLACTGRAEACMTRILTPPAEIQPYLDGKPDRPDPALSAIAQSFQRDKEYYDALVSDYCMVRPQADPAGEEFRRDIDSRLIALIARKWLDRPKK
ncbi:MAG: hypothetical protein GC185_10630 [Alphaproteobacteria bacterium]|nr:hypothetical protein [Alphaproteobacteria bacterium]